MSSSIHDVEDEQLPSYESCISDTVIHSVRLPPTGTPPTIPTNAKPARSSRPSQPRPVTSTSGPPPIPLGTRPQAYADNNIPSSPENIEPQTAPTEVSYPGPRPLIEGQYPSNTLCRLADALFHRLTTTDSVDPLGLVRASDPNVQNAELTPQMLFRLKRFLILAGIPFTLVGSGIPVLSRDSFIQWLVFEVRANPDYSYVTWQTRLQRYSLYDPQTHISFAPIPRMAFPERATDAVLTNVHDVWRAIVDVLGKRQGGGKQLPRIPQDSERDGIPSRLGGIGRASSHRIGGIADASERRCVRRMGRDVGRGILKGVLRGAF